MTWLPRYRTHWNPNRSNAQIVSSPDTRRSLGISRLECSQQRAVDIGKGKLFQIELRGFFKIGERILNRGALTHCPQFWACGDV